MSINTSVPSYVRLGARLAALVLASGLWLAPGRAHAYGALENRGGPMLATPEIAPLYLGNWDQASIDSTQAYLAGLVGYLNGRGAPVGRENVLRQYGVLGASLLPPGAPIPISNQNISKSDVPAILNAALSTSAFGYAPGRIVLAMTKGLYHADGSPVVDLGASASAYHDNNGDDRLFAFVPYELNADDVSFQNAISHELFETATDPYWQNGVSQKQAWIYWKSGSCFAGFCWGETNEGADSPPCGGSPVMLSFGAVTPFADNGRAQCDVWSTRAQPVAGDFDGDGHADIALVGGYRKSLYGRPPIYFMPVAYSDGVGFPRVQTGNATNMYWADTDNVTALAGDFNNDNATDIALVGGIGWGTVPVAFSNHAGSFGITNYAIDQFAAWAQAPGVQAVAGDFDGDGKTDIALAGGPDWQTVPFALSNGDGTFRVDNFGGAGAAYFASLMSRPGAKLIAGRFAGKTSPASVVVIGLADQRPMRLDRSSSALNYAFLYEDSRDLTFSQWSAAPEVKVTVGDFDGDGYDDIALSGSPGWASIPMAFTSWSTGYQMYTVQNTLQWDFGVWATVGGVTPVAGSFTNQGQADIALVGGWGWGTIPVDYLAQFPYSHSPPTYTIPFVKNPSVGSNFPLYAQ